MPHSQSQDYEKGGIQYFHRSVFTRVSMLLSPLWKPTNEKASPVFELAEGGFYLFGEGIFGGIFGVVFFLGGGGGGGFLFVFLGIFKNCSLFKPSNQFYLGFKASLESLKLLPVLAYLNEGNQVLL